MRQNRLLFYILIILIIISLQIGVMWIGSPTPDGINDESLMRVSMTTILNFLSGVLMIFLLSGGNKAEDQIRRPIVLLLGVFPALALLAKLSFAAFGNDAIRIIFPILGPIRFVFLDWVLTSHVPSFWLGLVAGWITIGTTR